MAFKCKSKRLKSLGKLSFLPGIFNVNEPVIFGLPLVLNPMMAIPFFIVPLVTVGISFAAMFFGLVPYLRVSLFRGPCLHRLEDG